MNRNRHRRGRRHGKRHTRGRSRLRNRCGDGRHDRKRCRHTLRHAAKGLAQRIFSRLLQGKEALVHCRLLRDVRLMDGCELRLLGHETGQVVVHERGLWWARRDGLRKKGRG